MQVIASSIDAKHLSIQAELVKHLFLVGWKSGAARLFTWTWEAIEDCVDTHNEGANKTHQMYESHRLSDWRGHCLSTSLSCTHGAKEYNLTVHPLN